MDSFNPRSIQEEYYGDTFRWFVGVVIDNNDPLQAGRVRVRIYGVHSEDLNDVPHESLPWAMPVIPSTEDGVSGLGRSTKLKPGAMVTGFFADGPQSQIPIIIGSLPRFAQATPGQLGEGSRYNTSSITGSAESPISKIENAGANGAQGQTYSTRGAVGKTNTEKAYNFFLTTGQFSPIQAAAICGNLIRSSNMDPTKKQGSDQMQQYGLCQWTTISGRRTLLDTFAGERGIDSSQLETQLQFIMYEFTEQGVRLYNFNKFIAQENIKNAATVFAEGYLRGTYVESDIETRIQYARDVYQSYSAA
jgi:hypothetical protein